MLSTNTGTAAAIANNNGVITTGARDGGPIFYWQ
jgi:hypothetical protein